MKGAEPIFIDKKSKVGILMIHGFSSTPGELRELASYLASKGYTVSAPLLAGHGLNPEEMKKSSVFDWANSVKEAYLRLKEKSEKILLIGNSFGSDLAFWLSQEFANDPIGIISLGAPIYLRGHYIILLRLYTYGLIQKFYKKPKRIFTKEYTDIAEVTYTKIPTRSVRQFLRFIQKNVRPILKKIKVPVLVVHSDNDCVVDPKSAIYIFRNLGSQTKKLYWFKSVCHTAVEDKNKSELFDEISDFMREILK